MQIEKNITLSFKDGEAQILKQMANLVLRNKRVLNENVATSEKGQASTIYQPDEYEKILALAKEINEA